MQTQKNANTEKRQGSRPCRYPRAYHGQYENTKTQKKTSHSRQEAQAWRATFARARARIRYPLTTPPQNLKNTKCHFSLHTRAKICYLLIPPQRLKKYKVPL